MSKINDGGPAFPLEYRHWEFADAPPEFKGMSLRDHFAGQALNGLLSNGEGVHVGAEPTGSILGGDNGSGFADWLAKQSYTIADAMLAAREPSP